MRLLKSNALLRLVNSYLVDSPEPANISYLWNFGSLLGMCLILQILSGVFLAMKNKICLFILYMKIEFYNHIDFPTVVVRCQI